MKVISIWNPFATLIVKGFKVYETRGWAPPKSVMGQRIGIASTKSILPAQRQHFAADWFRQFYDNLNLPDLTDMPNGYLLGEVTLDSCDLMTEEFMEEVSKEEQAYGWWEPGNYAWGLINPVEYDRPIPIRGQQGLFEWNGLDHAQKADARENPQEARVSGNREKRLEVIRSHLHLAKW